MKSYILLPVIIMIMAILVVSVEQAGATPTLVDWAFNDNGSFYDQYDASVPLNTYLPVNFNISNFNWATGLGTISVTYGTPGMYSLLAFFDQEVVEADNTFYNEYGTVNSIPAPGQSWEIDEPGWVYGDIYDNVLNGQLDNTNAIPVGIEDDVSWAMGWNFTVQSGQTAVVSFDLTEEAPNGFYLSQVDPTGSHYLSSSINIQTTPVPEPATFIMLATGLICSLYCAGLRRDYIQKTQIAF